MSRIGNGSRRRTNRTQGTCVKVSLKRCCPVWSASSVPWRIACLLTMEEIGQIYGISKMAVSKRLKKLHEKLGSSVS